MDLKNLSIDKVAHAVFTGTKQIDEIPQSRRGLVAKKVEVLIEKASIAERRSKLLNDKKSD